MSIKFYTHLHCREMVVANLTGEENRVTFEEKFCSPAALREEVYSETISILVLTTFLCITAFLGNTLILAALRKETSLHPPSKLMYCNLAITDLFVSIFSEPSLVAYWISVINKRWDMCAYAVFTHLITGYVLSSVSLSTMALISVDRLLALLLQLRYKQVVTLKKVRIAVVVTWVFAIVGALSFLLSPLIHKWWSFSTVSVYLLTPAYCYTNIFVRLRHRQRQIKAQDNVSQGQLSHPVSMDTTRYKKAVYITLWLQVALIVCYLPYGLAEALTKRQEWMPLWLYRFREIGKTLVLANSSLNPLLYSWKIREVRQCVKDTIRPLFCSSS